VRQPLDQNAGPINPPAAGRVAVQEFEGRIGQSGADAKDFGDDGSDGGHAVSAAKIAASRARRNDASVLAQAHRQCSFMYTPQSRQLYAANMIYRSLTSFN